MTISATCVNAKRVRVLNGNTKISMKMETPAVLRMITEEWSLQWIKDLASRVERIWKGLKIWQ